MLLGLFLREPAPGVAAVLRKPVGAVVGGRALWSVAQSTSVQDPRGFRTSIGDSDVLPVCWRTAVVSATMIVADLERRDAAPVNEPAREVIHPTGMGA